MDDGVLHVEWVSGDDALDQIIIVLLGAIVLLLAIWVAPTIGGMARYEQDYYHQVEKTNTAEVPGNPWAICTLWYAQWLIEKATSEEELREALPYIEWTLARAYPSGVLAEQFDPYTGHAISVSPLTWSHATVMIVVMKYLLRYARLTGRPSGCLAELSLATVA